MQILQELESFISDFNKSNNENFNIDSIRVEFSKQHKLNELKSLGKWNKVEKNSSLLVKLKKRLSNNEITSAWRLQKENIYYYNLQDAPKYRRAVLVIFGITQYNKPTPSREIISKLLQITKDISSVDICLDIPYKPNLNALSEHFTLTPYITSDGVITNTRYINETDILMLDSIVLYDKAFKNSLQGTLWRIEAKMSIPNFRVLALPLYEFKQITDIAKGNKKDSQTAINL
jgi:hypothetical protein